MRFHRGNEIVGFGWQAAGIEGKDFNGKLLSDDQIGQHHVFGAEAVGEDRGREFAGGAAQQAARARGFRGQRIEQRRVLQVDRDGHT